MDIFLEMFWKLDIIWTQILHILDIVKGNVSFIIFPFY